VLNVSFCSKNSLEKVDTDHQLIFIAVLKYSVAVSKLGKTDLVFVQPGAKINSVYYYHNVLEQGLLPDIHRSSNDNFLYQQDGALAFLFSRTEHWHTVHDTLSLTCTPMCPNSLNRKTGRQTVQI